MNYCPRCGAYIPDGFTECLACGYSAGAEKEPSGGNHSHTNGQNSSSGAAAQATAHATDPSEYHYSHAKTEQKKAEQQGNETAKEKEAREKVKEQFDQKTSERKDADDYQSVSYLSYLGPLFLVPYLMCKQSPFAMYHARQGIKLFLLEILVNACWGMGLLGVLAALAGTVLCAWCILNGFLNVSQKKKRPLPVIGNLGNML